MQCSGFSSCNGSINISGVSEETEEMHGRKYTKQNSYVILSGLDHTTELHVALSEDYTAP
jgi:hypothetical protein